MNKEKLPRKLHFDRRVLSGDCSNRLLAIISHHRAHSLSQASNHGGKAPSFTFYTVSSSSSSLEINNSVDFPIMDALPLRLQPRRSISFFPLLPCPLRGALQFHRPRAWRSRRSAFPARFARANRWVLRRRRAALRGPLVRLSLAASHL